MSSAEYSNYINHVISLGLAEDYIAQLHASCSSNRLRHMQWGGGHKHVQGEPSRTQWRSQHAGLNAHRRAASSGATPKKLASHQVRQHLPHDLQLRIAQTTSCAH